MDGDLRILFVEDQPHDAELCQHQLQRAGLKFTAKRIQTRATFEHALQEFVPDLILCDFSMPTDLDGFLALSIAREKAADIPFVFVSGTIGEERAVEAMKAGATDYVLKDNIERLGPVVQRALKEASQRRSVQEAQDALRVSEATFRSFMTHLPGRASIRDLDGRYTYVNDGWERAAGLEVENAHREVVATNAPVKRLLKQGAGGSVRYWLSHQFPVPGADGTPAMVGTIALDVTEQRLQEEKLAWLAWHDPVTGLANRASLIEELSTALRTTAHDEGGATAVLVWDVKRFRTINDSFGRDTGDALLREVALRIATRWPQLEHVARLSADYFAAYILNAGDAAELGRLLETSPSVLAEPFMVNGQEIGIGLSVGVAMSPQDGTRADALLTNAEAALRQAKARGEPYLFYEAAMNARVAERLSLESRLRRALDKDQFVLHYQPKIELATGNIAGFEALIRWNDPAGGLVAPAQIIPLLEETGLILDVGRWAICKVAEDWKERARRGVHAPRVAVNVSAMQLRRSDFIEAVVKALEHAGGGPHGLDLEITESLLMEDIAANAVKMHALKEMGVDIAIDDFGTGYSSLSYLAKLPLDALKIDRTFINTLVVEQQSMTIVSTIISLAHTLRMIVVAEGVETSEQAKMLHLLRCDQVQGYYYGKPAPWAEVFEYERAVSPAA